MTKPIEMEDVGAGGTVREPVPICRIHNSFLTVHGVDPVLGIRSTARSDCREETLDMGLAYSLPPPARRPSAPPVGASLALLNNASFVHAVHSTPYFQGSSIQTSTYGQDGTTAIHHRSIG
jgi:hypothetical protein